MSKADRQLRIFNIISIGLGEYLKSFTYIRISKDLMIFPGFPGGSDGKESAHNADLGLIPGSGRSPGGGNGNPLQSSCLENSMDRGAWQDIAHGVTKSHT